MSVSQDEKERAILRSRKMYQTDLASNLATAEDNGVMKGLERGKKIGREEGEKRWASLNRILLKDKRFDLLEQIIDDNALREQLFKRYNL